MTARPRQILACSGVLYPPQDSAPARYWLPPL
jgi:hypothetical protein